MKDTEKLVMQMALSTDKSEKKKIAKDILTAGYEKNIYPWSINDFYMARAKDGFGGFTVPAMNLRVMTYDLARAIFRAAGKINAGAFIFEIAKSEMGYTDQIPAEYTATCVAAAIAENFTGPVFIQGDHFQLKAANYKKDPAKEIDGVKALIKEAIAGGFYNIDIDSSTLVDLSKKDIMEEQYHNYMVCGELAKLIREIQPSELNISIGGEIGEVGGKNSTPEELRAFVNGFKKIAGEKIVGVSKISIQTGTSHGGVVLPDGTVAKVKVDFDTLKNLSKLAREEFGMAGAVQHGASTLPPEAFGKFPEMETAEIHLATQFQNMVYDSKAFPAELKSKIYTWIKENLQAEKKEGETEEQFIYKARKKALGPFKKDIINLSASVKKEITGELEKEYSFLFDKLKIKDTKNLITKYIKPKAVKTNIEDTSHVHLDGEGDD